MFSAPRQMFSGLNYKQSAARHGSKSSNGMVTADTKWDRWFNKRRPSLCRAMAQTLVGRGEVCPVHTCVLLQTQLLIKVIYFIFLILKHSLSQQTSRWDEFPKIQIFFVQKYTTQFSANLILAADVHLCKCKGV